MDGLKGKRLSLSTTKDDLGNPARSMSPSTSLRSAQNDTQGGDAGQGPFLATPTTETVVVAAARATPRFGLRI